jgi:hypothetical protein
VLTDLANDLVQAAKDNTTKSQDSKATPLFLSNKSREGNMSITLD